MGRSAGSTSPTTSLPGGDNPADGRSLAGVRIGRLRLSRSLVLAPKRCEPSGSIALRLSRSPRSMWLRTSSAQGPVDRMVRGPQGRSAGHFELEPSAAWIAEYYPTEAVTSLPGGGLIVSLRNRPRLAAWPAAPAPGGARVLSPDGAGDSAAESAREALDQYAVLLGTTAGAVSDASEAS